MKKLTKNNRIKAMDKGFKRIASITNKTLKNLNIDRFDYETVFNKIDSELSNNNAIEALQKLDYIKIDTVRSKDFIDTNGVYHDLKGKTYVNGNILIHDYESTNEYGYAMNVYMLNI